MHVYRSSCSIGNDLVDIPVSRNVSYETTALADHPTTRGPQSADPSGNVAATEYSRIDPLYALPTIQSRSQLQPVVGVSTRISERYEFSEAYLAVPEHDDGAHGGIQTETSNYY